MQKIKMKQITKKKKKLYTNNATTTTAKSNIVLKALTIATHTTLRHFIRIFPQERRKWSGLEKNVSHNEINVN